MKSRPLLWMWRGLALAAAYVAAGKLALLLAIPPGYATAVWPAAGIALVGVLLYGPRVAPGIWLGSFLTNIGTSFDATQGMHPPFVAAAIGIGAALQAIVGARLIRRFVGFPTPLTQRRDVVRFLALGGPVACLVNATCGVFMLGVAGLNPIDAAAFNWFTWWVGDTIGVLIFAPLVLTWLGPPAAVWRSRRISVGLPLCITFVATVLLFIYASAWERKRGRDDFERQAESLSRGIEQNIGGYMDVLRSVAGLYAGSNTVERDEFHTFVSTMMSFHPGIQAISWNVRVRDAQREKFEQAVRNEGFPQFQITDQNEQRQMIPASRRGEYTPVTYVEPYAGNEKALGYDSARGDRRRVQQKACDSGELAATGRLRPVQEIGDQFGVIVYVPVFRNGAPDGTLEDRRRNLHGFIAGVFRIDDVMETALQDADREGIALRLVDDSAPAGEDLLWGAPRGDASNGLRFSDSLEVAGLRWTLHAARDSSYLVAHRTLGSWMVLLGGLLLDSLLGSFLLMLTGRTARIEALVSERALQLSHAKVALEQELDDRAEAEKALRASEIQFRSVTASAHDAIVLADSDGRILSWNQAAQRCFGYEEPEALGQPLTLIIPERYRQAHLDGLARLRAGGVPRLIGKTVEIEGRRKDGTEFPLEIALSTWSAAGETFYSGILRDITERRRAEAELQRAKEAAEAANQAKSAFLANMSHEIRTPMNGVIGMTGLLLDTSLDEQQRDFVETIRSSGDYLLTVINDILDFSKIEAGYLELEVSRFDVRHCVEEAAELIALKGAEKDIELTYEVGDDVPQILSTDAGRLRQVLVNLIGNAVKFTERGDVVIEVDARPLDHPQWEVHFLVRDTGIGIPAERLAQLFAPFTQADTSVTRRFGGTGLGLTISKRLCELLGGRIWVESEVGRGSTFHFTIVADAEPAPVGPPVASNGLDGLRVLIVDDNATNRRILRLQTQSWAMHPRDTESPREALSWIAHGDPFDVAILDYHMPEMDGITLAREIQAACGAEPPLVLLSSSGDQMTADSVGTDIAVVLQKPVRPSTLHDTLANLLGRGPVTASEASEAAAAIAGAAKWRILLAEDNPVNQKVARLLLQRLGYADVDAVANGLEVIEALERQTYDVVLMDVQMPEMDGLDATRAICARWPRGRRPAIIAMTAHALAGDRERCLEAGMDGYIVKPIKSTALDEELRRCRRLAAPRAHTRPSHATKTLEKLLSELGDVQIVSEIVDGFASESQDAARALRDAIAESDARTATRVTHTLASMAAMVGASALSDLARETEQLAAAGDLDAVRAKIAALDLAVADAVRAVSAERDELQSGAAH